jgi:type II secretory pathway component GspD/PulD (secretin)
LPPELLESLESHLPKSDLNPTPAAQTAGADALESTLRRFSPDGSANPIKRAQYEEQQPPFPTQPPQPPVPGAPGGIVAPRSGVTTQALPDLGVLVISAANPEDMLKILAIIKFLQEAAPKSQAKIELVFLEHADATSVTNELNQMYTRVRVNLGGNVLSTTGTQTQVQQQTAAGTTTQTSSANASVVLIPVPRQNAILVGAQEARFPDVVTDIKKLDLEPSARSMAVPFKLQKASAQRVATLLQNFYAQRYQGVETTTQNMIRITYDDSTNTVFVQAAPADLVEIRDLIERLDTSVSAATNDLRFVRLRSADATELAGILMQAITQGIVPSTGGGGGIVPSGVPGTQGGLPGPQGGLPSTPGNQPAANRLGTTGTTGTLGQTGTTGVTTKTVSLSFVYTDKDGIRSVQSGLLEDVHVTPYETFNSLLVSAPPKSMELILRLIDELDRPRQDLVAEVKIITLKKADAATMASTLNQLFNGTSTTTGGAFPSAFPSGGAGTGGTGRPLAVSVQGQAVPGSNLVDFRVTIDERTNSVIVAGQRQSVILAEALATSLDESTAPLLQRRNEVYHLRNASAPDVATSLQTFLNNTYTLYAVSPQWTDYFQLQQQVVVVPEPITNKLLISATPQYFGEVMKLIAELDTELPQVAIQVLLADVTLSGSEEFGVEIGLQSPVLFQRSVIPAFNFSNGKSAGGNALGTGTVSYANATGGLVPPGVTVTGTQNPTAQPGFNFNNVSLPLGSNPLVGTNIVGVQGLGNLGVGRISPTSQVGGFVFSAASDSFNLLVRALKTQDRLDVMARPQVTTTDGQQAQVVIGQFVPYVTGASISSLGTVTPIINYRDVGIILNVTPRISPDGKVIMRVHPEVSAVAASTINLGNGINATVFDDKYVDTTVLAADGETVAIGGLINRSDEKHENKIPFLGDLPCVGALFRYRTQVKSKRELIVILTPHIVRSRAEADRILAEESRRMDWVLGDVIKSHGAHGMAPLFPAPQGAPGVGNTISGDGPACGPLVPTPTGPVLPGAAAPLTLPPPGGSSGQPVPAAPPVPGPALIPVPGAAATPAQPPLVVPTRSVSPVGSVSPTAPAVVGATVTSGGSPAAPQSLPSAFLQGSAPLIPPPGAASGK